MKKTVFHATAPAATHMGPREFLGQFRTEQEAREENPGKDVRIAPVQVTRGAWLVWEKSGFKPSDWIQC